MPGLDLYEGDIDIAHRLGKADRAKRRQIIVKLKSRMTKIRIMRIKKTFKGKNIYINEDMTRVNQEVFSCMRKKKKESVSSVWTQDGVIRYRDYTDHIQLVNYTNFKY